LRKNLGVATAIVIIAVVVAIVAGFGVGWVVHTTTTNSTNTNTTTGLHGVYAIGAAIPLTGDLGTYGQNANFALQLAETQINNMLAASNAGWSIKLIVLDTKTDPGTALTDTKTLAADGCQAIIGYYSSGELSNCKAYAEDNDIVLISPSSTAVSLAIDKPYIFRFVPADNAQGPAMAAQIWAEGIKYMVPLYMVNTYGEGLAESTESAFIALGGTVSTQNVSYDPTTTSDYTALVQQLNGYVASAISTYGASHVCVYAVTYEEVENIMDVAATDYNNTLGAVKWFGCDGSALSAKVTSDPISAAFAIQTQFPATYYAPTNSSIQTQVMQYVAAKTGNVPDPYAFGSYDALWVVAKCMGLTQQYSGTAINTVLPTVANYTFGASGWDQLNQYGDAIAVGYQYWQVYKVNSTAYSWYLAGYYDSNTGQITNYPSP